MFKVSHQWKLKRVLASANIDTMSSGFNLAVRSDSMLRTANDERRSCDMVDRSQLRIRLIAEKLRSALAVPTGSVN